MLRSKAFHFFDDDLLADGDKDGCDTFQHVDRASLLQDTKKFSAATINVKSCTATLVKLLYLLGQGETLTSTEATEIFFGVTKLFQTDHPSLRRLMYIALKELSPLVEQCFVASAQLVKDIHGSVEMYRAHAIRTLRKITDASTLTPFERYLKQATVDRSAAVSCAALVTALHLTTNPETASMVRRWSTEVGEAMKHRSSKVQYAALILMHRLGKSERLTVVRLVQSVQQGPVRSPLAVCFLLKLSTQLLHDDFPGNSTDLLGFMASCLRHSNDCVVFEAARGLVSLQHHLSSKEISPVILVMHMYVNARRPLLQFGAVRLLCQLATTAPSLVAPYTVDLESLLHDPNRNIATLAVMTLLKAGPEHAVERLLKEAGAFLSDLDDDFRTVVVETAAVLIQKHPSQYAKVMHFFSEALQGEGGLVYKRAVLESIIHIVTHTPDARELGIAYLCDFIQDCEHTVLTARVVHFLGDFGPRSAAPHRCLRHILNRILLERSVVRAVAVSAAAKFASVNPEMRRAVQGLLTQVMYDVDDEVRDRALLLHQMLNASEGSASLAGGATCEVDFGDEEEDEEDPEVYHVLRVLYEKTEQRRNGASTSNANSNGGEANKAVQGASSAMVAGTTSKDTNGSPASVNDAELMSVDAEMQRVYGTTCGRPFRVSEVIFLTEPDSEYVVRVRKYTYPQSLVVLHYTVTNTMDDQWLVRPTLTVRVSEEDANGGLSLRGTSSSLTTPWLAPSQAGSFFALFDVHIEDEAPRPPTGETVHTTLHFSLAEEEPNAASASASRLEHYPLEPVVLQVIDFLLPMPLPTAGASAVDSFQEFWDRLGGEAGETKGTYALPSSSLRTVHAAISRIVAFYGIHVVGDAGSALPKENALAHTLRLSGKCITLRPPAESAAQGVEVARPVLIQARAFLSSGDRSVALEICVRGLSEDLRAFLIEELL